MNLVQLVGRYQNKISKYDKHGWEESVEHKIINKFSKKSPTKQKAELIDVDLVRGKMFYSNPELYGGGDAFLSLYIRIELTPQNNYSCPRLFISKGQTQTNFVHCDSIGCVPANISAHLHKIVG